MGRSNNPSTRCQNLKAGNPFPLVFLKTILIIQPLQVAEAENYVRKELAKVYGNNFGGETEWFEVQANIVVERE